MVRIDERALICDLAETYHIFSMREHPASFIATLATGLRPDSRIMMKLSNQTYDLHTLLLASVADRLSLLVWAQTKDAKHNRNRPASIYELLTKPTQKATGFVSAEAFERRRAQILKEIQNGKKRN